MSRDDRPPPDFAMLRAVEILAGLAERKRDAALTPPPPIDRPVIFFNETCTLELGVTTRRNVRHVFDPEHRIRRRAGGRMRCASPEAGAT